MATKALLLGPTADSNLQTVVCVVILTPAFRKLSLSVIWVWPSVGRAGANALTYGRFSFSGDFMRCDLIFQWSRGYPIPAQFGHFVCSLDSWRYFRIEIAIYCTFHLESMSFGLATKPVFQKPGKISKRCLVVHRSTSEDGHIAFMVNLGNFNVSNNMFQD